MRVEDEDGIEGGRASDAEVNAWLAEQEQEVHLIPLGVLLRPVWAVCGTRPEAEERMSVAVDDGDMISAARYAVESAWFLGVSEFLRVWEPTGMAS